ncbi:MAG: trypsin-like peptidase domain-containing protein, partial [Nanoarchaeota archaeon]
KHVVSDRDVKYIVVDSKGTKYNVERIYRDPLNDIAILKVANPSAERFREVKLGNSDNLEVGQFAIAIGTALGEFRNTVTTGVISGLGRGITAGNPFEGFVERLDNVIQTDAAINPGNSGGPLLNSAGEVVGVNAAVASAGQNIGFAIPINVVKESIRNFNQTGQFDRAFLGVSYVMMTEKAAVLNNLPQGAFVRDISEGSPAQKAGLKTNDIITKIDGENVTENNNLAVIINKKKVRQEVSLTVLRDGKTIEINATLSAVPNQ